MTDPSTGGQNPAYILGPSMSGQRQSRRPQRPTCSSFLLNSDKEPRFFGNMLRLFTGMTLRRTFGAVLGTGAVVFGIYAYLFFSLPRQSTESSSSVDRFQWPDPTPIEANHWSVFQSLRSDTPPSSLGPLAARFRLAGTFFAFGDASETSNSYCKAILDDLEKKEQRLVSEGDDLDGIRVARILRDRVVLLGPAGEEELWLSFAGGRAGSNVLSSAAAAAPGSGELPSLEVNRFGKRVGEGRWVLSRDALMNYYREVMDDPERVASLYVSMKPDYREGVISGYLVDPEGEQDFFRATGLQNGDIVRKVNSMNMISQKRAEYFIGEFAKNRVSALVIDIEREGQAKKLIYMIR
jgi:type II secretory pathway component PulC